MTGWSAVAIWQPVHGDCAVTVSSGYAGPVAVIPLPDDGGRPSTGSLDDLLAVLGYTRLGPWGPHARGLVADVEPMRGGS